MTTNQLVQKTVEVPQEQIEVTALRVTSQNAPIGQWNAAATECTDSAPREEKNVGEKLTNVEAEKMIKETDVDNAQ